MRKPFDSQPAAPPAARPHGMTRLRAAWETVRTTYWAVPSVMALAALALSIGMIQLDRALTPKLLGTLSWVYTGGPEGARAVLSTIAGSMITVAGVTFSITIVALTLASQQFGPRLLRSFLRDLGNQIVLGTFVSTFVYCLLVLRTVRGNDDAQFVPHLAVTLGVVLAMLSLGVLIFFIHHVSTSIQASQIIAGVAADLEALHRTRLFPGAPGRRTTTSRRSPLHPFAFDGGEARMSSRSSTSGYVQAIDGARLMSTATERDLVVRVEAAPGQFVRRDAVLASVRSEAVWIERSATASGRRSSSARRPHRPRMPDSSWTSSSNWRSARCHRASTIPARP